MRLYLEILHTFFEGISSDIAKCYLKGFECYESQNLPKYLFTQFVYPNCSLFRPSKKSVENYTGDLYHSGELTFKKRCLRTLDKLLNV